MNFCNLMYSKKFYTILTFLSIGVIFFAFLGVRRLANPDEGRYAEIAREMNATGNWVVPRLNGILYFEKPPLVYWINAVSQKLGNSIFFSRFLNTFLAFSTALLLYLFGRRLSSTTGLWSALVFSTSALSFGMSQMLTLDTGVTFFITTSLLLFLEAFLSTERAQKWFFSGAFLSMGLAVMAKGLIGFVFPALVLIPWIVLSRNLKILKNKWLWIGIVLCFLLLLPWHLAIILRHPEFFKFYFWHEHFERYLTSAHNRSKPLCFIPLSFLIGFSPWMLFLPRALWQMKREVDHFCKKRLLFMALWSVSVVLFFTFSNSQLIPYVLPAIPPAAILVGYLLSKIDKDSLKVEIWLAGLAYLVGAFIIPIVATKKAVEPIPLGIFIGICGLLFFGGASIIYWLKNPQTAFKNFLLITLLFFFFCPLLMPFFQRPNTRGFADFILKIKKCPNEVFCAYDYFQDFPFYLKQTIGIIDHVPDEQGLGTRLEPCSRYISSATLKHRWTQNKCLYVLVRSKDENIFKQSLSPLALYALIQDKHFILFSNQP